MTLGEALVDLQQLTERLRRDCPWDREQTTKTIAPHTVEEAYEVADAALAEDDAKLSDELGDLLFQTFFLSLLLEERGQGGLEAVARGIHEKLVRRHPHVFAGVEAKTAARVRENWEQIKVREDETLFGGISRGMPALVLARKVQQRAAGIGFEYADVEGALEDLEDELRELREDLHDPERAADEAGDVLFACVNVARRLGADAELALRRATLRFVGRVEQAAELARRDGHEFSALPLDAQDQYFDRAKETQ